MIYICIVIRVYIVYITHPYSIHMVLPFLDTVQSRPTMIFQQSHVMTVVYTDVFDSGCCSAALKSSPATCITNKTSLKLHFQAHLLGSWSCQRDDFSSALKNFATYIIT